MIKVKDHVVGEYDLACLTKQVARSRMGLAHQ